MVTLGKMCRTWNGYDINYQKIFEKNIQRVLNGEDLHDEYFLSGAQKDGRGNIVPVTIIMPTLAEEIVQSGSEDVVGDFMKLLDEKINEAKEMLIERNDYICAQNAKSAQFMYENGTMFGYNTDDYYNCPEKGVKDSIIHGTLAIGQIGLAETLQILIGTNQITNEGMELAKRIENLFYIRCNEFKHQYHLNFSVYMTPAENLCKKAMDLFKKRFGVIPNVSDKKFFTNSIHCPVWSKLDPFEKIDIEAQLTNYSNAGTIMYVELKDEILKNIDALEELVNYAMDKDLSYFAINVPADFCSDCGYTGEIPNTCPKCGSSHIQRLRRVTGYLTGDYVTAFNEGKQQEVEMRFNNSSLIKTSFYDEVKRENK